MPHLASASVQDFHSSTKLAFDKLSQRYSDDVSLLSSQAQATLDPRRSRTDSLEQIFNGGLPSPPASESDEAGILAPETNSKHYHFVHRLPRTPSTDKELDSFIKPPPFACVPNPELHISSIVVPISAPCTPPPGPSNVRHSGVLPFPLEPSPTYVFESSAEESCGRCQRPKRRCVSAEAGTLIPPTSPDRYISNRHSPQPRSSTFRTSKSPQQLSSAERLLRHNSVSQDPFSSPTRAREGRRVVSGNDSGQESRPAARAMSGTNVFSSLRSNLTVHDRQASAGAVWNVGGNSATSPTGPMQGVPNGRGGMFGSGTNAPLYTSRFLEGETPDQDLERLEGRLAIALELDQTSRVLEIPASPARARYVATDSVASKRKFPFIDSRTRWKEGAWVQEGKSSCEFAFVRSIANDLNYTSGNFSRSLSSLFDGCALN